METHTHKGFDETSSIPIPQRSPLEVSQKGTNEKINTMLKFSENLIMQNIKMKRIVTGLADRIAKLEAIILNGKLQKTIEDTITKREKTIADLSRRTGIGRPRASETPIESTQVPSLVSKNVVEFNLSAELKDPHKTDGAKSNTEFNEQIRTLAEIQQMKTPGQESTQELMQNIQDQKMLTTPEVNNFLVEALRVERPERQEQACIELSSNSEEPKSDSDTSGVQSNSTASSIVFVEPATPPQNHPEKVTLNELPSENKTVLNVVNDDLILELEPIEPAKTPAPQEQTSSTEPKTETKSPNETTMQDPIETIEIEPAPKDTPQTKEHETNPLVASARRRRRKP